MLQCTITHIAERVRMREGLAYEPRSRIQRHGMELQSTGRLMRGDTGCEIAVGRPYHQAWAGRSGYSLKSYRGGSAVIRIERRTYRLTGREYLVVNRDQEYALETRGTNLRNFTAFFTDRAVDEAVASLFSEDETSVAAQSIEPVFEHELHLLTGAFEQVRHEMSAAVRPSAWQVDAAALRILDLAVSDQQRARHEASSLSCARASTRAEVHRRLRRAITFMEDELGNRLSLAQCAAAAAMSRFHFSRRFHEAFGLPPHAYLLQRRIERAADLLRHSRLPVGEIAAQCGFPEQSRFSSAFRRLKGVPPSQWRRISQDS